MAAEKKIDDEIDDELFAMAIVDAKFQEWLENPTEIEGRKKILAKKYNVQEDAPIIWIMVAFHAGADAGASIVNCLCGYEKGKG